MADDERSAEPSGGDAPAPEEVVPTGTSAAAPPPPAPAAPRTAPAPGTAGPARRSRRWLVALLIVLGLIVVLGAAGGVLFVDRTLPPYEAADDFIDDLADGRFQAAADQLCRADQEDPDGAIETVTRHFEGRDNVTVNPFGVSRDGDRARVDYSVSTDDGANDFDDETFELPVREENGDWKPCPSDA